MGALADLALEVLGVREAALFFALAFVDIVQVKWMDQRLESHEGRIMRVETKAMTDGGTEEE